MILRTSISGYEFYVVHFNSIRLALMRNGECDILDIIATDERELYYSRDVSEKLFRDVNPKRNLCDGLCVWL